MPDELDVWPPPQPEIDVLRMHMEGRSDRAIAVRLGMSLTTVRRLSTRARRRCAARTRAEAIAVLVSEGLIPIRRRPS